MQATERAHALGYGEGEAIWFAGALAVVRADSAPDGRAVRAARPAHPR